MKDNNFNNSEITPGVNVMPIEDQNNANIADDTKIIVPEENVDDDIFLSGDVEENINVTNDLRSKVITNEVAKTPVVTNSVENVVSPVENKVSPVENKENKLAEVNIPGSIQEPIEKKVEEKVEPEDPGRIDFEGNGDLYLNEATDAPKVVSTEEIVKPVEVSDNTQVVTPTENISNPNDVSSQMSSENVQESATTNEVSPVQVPTQDTSSIPVEQNTETPVTNQAPNANQTSNEKKQVPIRNIIIIIALIAILICAFYIAFTSIKGTKTKKSDETATTRAVEISSKENTENKETTTTTSTMTQAPSTAVATTTITSTSQAMTVTTTATPAQTIN